MKRLEPNNFPLAGHQLIEASAGTGKTFTITNLYLRLLLGRDNAAPHPLRVDQILVLTFTIAATEELRARIRKRIREARDAFAAGNHADPFLDGLVASSPDRDRDARLLTAAAQLLDEASIFTIHGFCARVLADNAFESGALFDQRLDADRDELLEQATQDCFRADILTLPDFSRRIALSRWSSPSQLQDELGPFLFRSGLEVLPAPDPVDERALVQKIRSAKRQWLEDDFEGAIRQAKFNGNTRVVRRLRAMTAWCRTDEVETDLWPTWCTKTLEHTNLNKGGQYPDHPLIATIDEICQDLDRLPVNLWHMAIDSTRARLEHEKEERAQLTLDDLLTRVHAAMGERHGQRLAENLASRWPVAMIDEFQDTDDVQWGIFSSVYGDHGRGLFVIGDPKQAIYQFRGADVYTYINAKRGIASQHDLDTNWRSTRALVEAVNLLFDQPHVFGNDEDIPFGPVRPSPKADAMSITESRQPVTPVTLVRCSSSEAKKDAMRRLAMSWAAEEAARLLQAGARGDYLIDGEPLRAGQIAFLVRDRRDAAAARAALAERNIHAVYVTLESVFLTETADDLRLILHAVLEPTHEANLRAAMATPLMQSTAAEIHALNDDIVAQQAVLEEFSRYHRLWAEMDIATMIEALVEQRQIARKWFGRPGGERQITNLRHLTELLQERASVAPGMHRLLKWFVREKAAADTVAADERQLRLESDRDLVQIVTMHAAKGLEYEVVMIPNAAFTSPPKATSGPPWLLHERRQDRFQTVLDLRADDGQKQKVKDELLFEEMRLLYVAITRARHKLYLGIPETGDLPKSALARLLKLELAGGGEALINALQRWDSLPSFEVMEAVSVAVTPWVPPHETASLVPPRQPPVVRSDWRVHSYTGVSRLVSTTMTAPGVIDTPGFSDDDPDSQGPAVAGFSRHSFPRGPRVGIALHTLMEHVDFTRPVAEQQALMDHCLDRVGLTAQRDNWRQMLIQWLSDILTTDMGGTRLADISRDKRLDELEFHFPLAATADIIDLVQQYGYCHHATALDPNRLQGMMTGMIDLVFEAGGAFRIVDYKSNYLGAATNAYDDATMKAAVAHHLYDLQYLVYTVALHRYLGNRLHDYDYDRDFSGVAYLFLRGMAGGEGATGVHLDRPPRELIERLDSVLTGRRAA